MFKLFEFPWTRKKRLAEEARRAETLRREQEKNLRRQEDSFVGRSTQHLPWHLKGTEHVGLSARAAESRRVRELRERLEEEARLRRVREEEDRRRDGDFLTSMVVAQATNSTLMGYAVGGNLAGAMVGDALVPDTEPKREETWHGNGGELIGAGASASWEREEVRTPDPEPEPERSYSSPSYESSSSSYESSSSSDSSSSDSGSSSSSD
jgi:hypothetical protein